MDESLPIQTPQESQPEVIKRRSILPLLIAVAVICLGIGALVGFMLKDTTSKIGGLPAPTQQQTNPTTAVAVASQTTEQTEQKVYFDNQDKYELKYPSDYFTKPSNDLTHKTLFITPVAMTESTMTEAIVVTTYEIRDATIEEYIKQNISSNPLTYTPVTIDNKPALRTDELPGQVESEAVFVKNGITLYQISHLKSGGIKIPQEIFENVLKSFHFS